MSLPGFVAAGIGSAAGGGALMATIAVSLAQNLLFTLMALTVGALLGSLVGWFQVTARTGLPIR